MEIGNIAKYNKGFRYLLNCIDIYTVCKKQAERFLKLLSIDGVEGCDYAYERTLCKIQKYSVHAGTLSIV